MAKRRIRGDVSEVEFRETMPGTMVQPIFMGDTAEIDTQRSMVGDIIYLILGITESLLALRLVLRLFGASTANAFVQFIYVASYPLIWLFEGIFNTPVELTQANLEIATIIAMLVYAIAAYLIIRLVAVLRAP